MALTVDTFSVVVARLISFLQANTTRIDDYNTGSVTRTLLEAVALEFDKQYFQLERVQKASYIQTAAGDDLAVTAQDFGLTRVASVKATGFVNLSRLTPAPPGGILIPAGSVWSTLPSATPFDAVRFVNVADITMPAGDTTLAVPIEAVVAGSDGNVLIGEIIVNSSNVAGIDGATNLAPTTGGDNEESDTELRGRIQTLLKGNTAGTEDSYKNILLSNTTAVVSSISVVGPGDALMTRDSGVGGKLDIYFKGNVNPQSFAETFVFVNGTDYFFSPNQFDPPDFPNQRNVPVTGITMIEDLTAADVVAVIDYNLVNDTSVFVGSDRAQDKITFANMPTRDGHTFRVTFMANKTVGDLRTLIEPFRPITADVIIKAGFQQLMDANIKPFYAPGVDHIAANVVMQDALEDYINELGLGGANGTITPGLFVTEAIRRMSEVKVDGLLAVVGFDKTLTTVFKTGIPTTDSLITIDKATYFVANSFTFL